MSASPPAPAPPSARSPSLDGLRGGLAAIVFLDHLLGYFGCAALCQAASFAVYAFFVMSAYVLAPSYDGDCVAFLVKRLVRLWPVYAFCLALAGVVEGRPPYAAQAILYPVLNPGPQPAIDPPSWSLCVEAWAMPFMPLFVWCGRGPLWRLVGGVAVIELAGRFDTRVLFLLYFALGAYLSRYPFRLRRLDGALLQGLGRVSYSLYLVHWPILAFAARHYGPIGALSAAPVALAASVALTRFVDEPSVRLSRRVARWVRANVTGPALERLAAATRLRRTPAAFGRT